MKKKFWIFFVIFFSFFILYQILLSFEKKDPIFLQVLENASSYHILPVEGILKENKMIVGKKGKEVDVSKSYRAMKQYGTYNEALTTMKSVSPSISMMDHYDKYLIQGNLWDRKVSLLFPITSSTDFSSILSILKEKDVRATFFLEGTVLEKNTSLIRKNLNHEFEILSYDGKYTKSLFQTSLSYLESLTKEKPLFCYTEEVNESFLAFCQKLKLHTVKVDQVHSKELYSFFKQELNNGMFFSLKWNSSIEKELPIVIDYIHSKGYEIVPLKELLTEE